MHECDFRESFDAEDSMDKELVVNCFRRNFRDIMDNIQYCAIYVDYVDKEVCSKIAKGLKFLAESGEKKAAALYCAIAAYGKADEFFINETAAELVLKLDAFDEYNDIIEELFSDVLDEDEFQVYKLFPIIVAFDSLEE